MGYLDLQGIWREGVAPASFNGVVGAKDPGLAPQYGVPKPIATPFDYSMRAGDRLGANIPTPVTPSPTMPSSTVGISDAEVLALERGGYREGDMVPNRGVLLPDGTFRQTGSMTGTATSGVIPPPTSIGGLQASTGFKASTGYNPEEQAQIDEYNNRIRQEANQVIDPSAIYQQNLMQRQAEIDSINSMYADLLNQSRVRGQGRIESRQFAQGRAGQIGSGTGEAGINEVQGANAEEQMAIHNQKQAALSNVYAKIRDYTREDIAAKETAKKSSAADYVAFLKSEPERRAKNVAASVKLALQNNLTSISQEDLTNIAKELNVTPEVIAAEFQKQVAEKQAEVASAEAEGEKSAAELRYKGAQAGLLEAQTGQVGKMTEGERARLAQDAAQFERTYALAREKANFDIENENPMGDAKPVFAGESLDMTEEKATTLSQIGVQTSDIVTIQALLNKGYSLKQIAQASDMSDAVFQKLSEELTTK